MENKIIKHVFSTKLNATYIALYKDFSKQYWFYILIHNCISENIKI